jgi:hypothetical protein
MNRSISDEIANAGGAVTFENCPKVLPQEHLTLIHQDILQIAGNFSDFLIAKGFNDRWGAITLTLSSSFSCRVTAVDGGGFAILIPLGFPARIRVLARILLRYWDNLLSIRTIQSPLDDLKMSKENIPDLLKPLLLNESNKEFWDQLFLLDKSLDIDEKFEPDVRELVYYSLLFLLSHEFTHIAHGHFELNARIKDSELLNDQKTLLIRGMEIDADDGASQLLLFVVLQDIQRVMSLGQETSLETCYLRLAYAVPMIFAISHTYNKFFGKYDAGNYNHPMVRCELFFNSIHQRLHGSPFIEPWLSASSEGFSKCVLALDQLNFEIATGRFGKVPDFKNLVLYHTLQYSTTQGGPTDYYTQKKCQEAIRLRNEVRKLLPFFGASYDCPLKVTTINSSNSERILLGVYGVDPPTIELLKDNLGSEQVLCFIPPDTGDSEKYDSTKFKDSLVSEAEAFGEKINHMLLFLDSQNDFAHGSYLFWTSISWVIDNQVKSLTCITDPLSQSMFRDQLNNCAERTTDPRAEELEASGRLLLANKFDIEVLKTQIYKHETRSEGKV